MKRTRKRGVYFGAFSEEDKKIAPRDAMRPSAGASPSLEAHTYTITLAERKVMNRSTKPVSPKGKTKYQTFLTFIA